MAIKRIHKEDIFGVTYIEEVEYHSPAGIPEQDYDEDDT